MADFEPAVMQGDIAVGRPGFRAVFFIPCYRAPDSGELGADLVIPAGFKIDFQKGKIRSLEGRAPSRPRTTQRSSLQINNSIAHHRSLGSRVTFCVDMFKSKGDIKKNAPCKGGGGEVTFSQIQTEIFNPSCALAGCHSGSGSPEGMDLDAGESYDNIVNVPAAQDSTKDRIEPRDPDNSYLINKVRGDGGISGARMPPAGGALSAAKIDMLEKWVEAGAKNN